MQTSMNCPFAIIIVDQTLYQLSANAKTVHLWKILLAGTERAY